LSVPRSGRGIVVMLPLASYDGAAQEGPVELSMSVISLPASRNAGWNRSDSPAKCDSTPGRSRTGRATDRCRCPCCATAGLSLGQTGRAPRRFPGVRIVGTGQADQRVAQIGLGGCPAAPRRPAPGTGNRISEAMCAKCAAMAITATCLSRPWSPRIQRLTRGKSGIAKNNLPLLESPSASRR